MTTSPTLKQFHVRELEEVECFRFMVDASQIGLAPGVIPKMIAAYEPLGNGEPFVLVRELDYSLFYQQYLGRLTIEVLQD